MLRNLSPGGAQGTYPGGRRTLLFVITLLAILGLLSVQGFAQGSAVATIVGTITDPSGAAVPNAKVTVTQIETGISRQVTTTSDGQYVVANLNIGNYNLSVDAAGFKKVEQNGFNLAVDDRKRFDFKLVVGSASEQVTVEATTQGVQTDSSEVSAVVNSQQVSKLAMNGRSIYTLINLTTGSTSVQPDFQTPTPVGGNANVSFNGARMSHNIYLLDGGEDLDRGGAGTFSVMPSMEAIGEFRTLTSNYTADYGLSSAATITSTLKSGTKTLHASAWEYVRNKAFNANKWFDASKPQLNVNIFGFNAGGQAPFGKNHPTFFFYNMEWRKIRSGQSINQQVPLTSTYGGNFAGTSAAASLHAPCPNQISAGLQAQFAAAGQALSTCDPVTGKLVTPAPFVYNGTTGAINPSLISPNATALLNAGIFPGPTNGSNYTVPASAPTNVTEEIVRIDHTFTDKWSIFGHFIAEQINQGFATTQWSGDNVPTVGNNFGNPSYSAVVHATDIISPTLLNEIAFNYNGNRIHMIPNGVVSAPSDYTRNRIFNGPVDLNAIPGIQLSGSTGTNYTSNWQPWNNKADSYQIKDDVSWTKGNHQFKFGGDVLLYRKSQQLFAQTQGGFQFNGGYTGNDFADFLLGYASNYNEAAVKDEPQWNSNSYAAYIQDNWRASSKLTLNLGLRWDGVPHTYEANNRMGNFYTSMYNPSLAPVWAADGSICSGPPGGGINPGCPATSASYSALITSPNPILAGYQFYGNGVGIEGQNGVPKGLVNNNWAALGPRIGFAYDINGKGQTVIRGGFGLMYERIQGNDMYNAGPNIPFSDQVGVTSVLLQNPNTSVTSGATVPTNAVQPANIYALNQNMYSLPTTAQFSAGVQQAIGAKSVFTVQYVGSQMRHQSDIAQIALPAYSSLGDYVNKVAGITPYNQAVSYGGFHSITMAQNEGTGHYNSLQTSFRGQMRELSVQAGYTYSKSIDSTSGNGGNGWDLNYVSNPYVGWKYDVGPSVFDRSSVFFVNFVYDIPLMKNSSNKAAKIALGGWQVSGIVSAMTGAPLNISVSGQNVSSIVPNTQNRPDLTGTITYPHTVAQWFSPAAFSTPAAGTWGGLPFDALRGPGRDNWNVSMFKQFLISESRGSHFEFRADCFNLWNHRELQGSYAQGGIGQALNGSQFGQVTAAYDPRIFQLGAKLVF
ncbi:MAG TPA: carboxypeptidase regulatory-like domain-containing protein [Terriglobales bacterium]|nr:carboxypeptidase regulatory-like domain-containing protein [Terriglobales bacterium]